VKGYEKPPQNVSPVTDNQSDFGEPMFPAVTEKITSSNDKNVSKIVDDLTEIEEQYIAAEYPYQSIQSVHKVCMPSFTGVVVPL